MCYGMNCSHEDRYSGECRFHGRGMFPCAVDEEEAGEEFAFSEADPEEAQEAPGRAAERTGCSRDSLPALNSRSAKPSAAQDVRAEAKSEQGEKENAA